MKRYTPIAESFFNLFFLLWEGLNRFCVIYWRSISSWFTHNQIFFINSFIDDSISVRGAKMKMKKEAENENSYVPHNFKKQ